MKKNSTIGLVLISTFAAALGASAGTIDFYEGENATQTKHCTLKDDKKQSYNLTKKGSPCPNDEVKSVVLRDVKAGTIIELYDDPKGSPKKDDYCKIVVLKSKNEYVIKHLEMQSFEDEHVKFTYAKDNGLNGKVSHIKITLPKK
ncbi:MAG: hypothetical protein K0Q55_1140 [Verrucomicrobia bacterium]|jgi:hypothetical protein|nr:hypothetical protein [Verrucomicrobiota bacterium]